MTYRILIDPSAERELRKLPRAQRRQLAALIDALADDPRPPMAVRLEGVDAHRIRSGDYRIVYAVRDDRLIVLVIRVGNRRDVYRDISLLRSRLKRLAG